MTLRDRVGVYDQVCEIIDHRCTTAKKADRILALVERECVERERKAFVSGAVWVRDETAFLTWNRSAIEGDEKMQASRRYPLPKEE